VDEAVSVNGVLSTVVTSAAAAKKKERVIDDVGAAVVVGAKARVFVDITRTVTAITNRCIIVVYGVVEETQMMMNDERMWLYGKPMVD
jgi:hypothetical protein